MAEIHPHLRVFLSGGTRGNWREVVKGELPEFRYFDPTTLRSVTSMEEIAVTERNWLDQSDIVFFYFEESNPSGLGSAFEVGYAVARGVPVVFVDEKLNNHTEWLAVHCTSVTTTLDDGIRELRLVADRFSA
jgi:nucleoside 2-deoxyribosyltransferase